MERTGWNAVIYDVDWARFIPGKKCNNVDCKHVGTDITDHCPNCGSADVSDIDISIYNNGRECETNTETEDKVIVEADPNSSTLVEKIGHILFRQKGSDRISIVCFKVNKGTVYYTLEADIYYLETDICELEKTKYGQEVSNLDIINYAKTHAGLYVKGSDGSIISGGACLNHIEGAPVSFTPPYLGYLPSTGTVFTIVFRYNDGTISCTCPVEIMVYPKPDKKLSVELSTISGVRVEANLIDIQIKPKESEFPCSGGELTYEIKKKYTISADTDDGCFYRYTDCDDNIVEEAKITIISFVCGNCNNENNIVSVRNPAGRNNMEIVKSGYDQVYLQISVQARKDTRIRKDLIVILP